MSKDDVATFLTRTQTMVDGLVPVNLCSWYKVYQKLVRRHIIGHAEGSFTRDQHGFIGGRSCTFNLLEAFDAFFFWTCNPRRGTPPAGVTLG